MLLFSVVIKEYIAANEKAPFTAWFDRLDSQTAAKVVAALARIELGNTSNVKSVGDGVLEYRIHFGAGIRIYFGKDGDALVILLGGGTKRRQQKDIEAAKIRWQQYKDQKEDH